MNAPVRVLVATRNAGKIAEIGSVLRAFPRLLPVSLGELGLEPTAAENDLESFPTFEANALAKARYFAERAGLLTLADDSGLCVDALDGAPGVRSRRFAPHATERGTDQDRANNEHLLKLLESEPNRRARFVCAVALAWPDGRATHFIHHCAGSILRAPRGGRGFGYDPLFFIADERATFAELPPERKNVLSHRGQAVRAAAARLSVKA